MRVRLSLLALLTAVLLVPAGAATASAAPTVRTAAASPVSAISKTAAHQRPQRPVRTGRLADRLAAAPVRTAPAQRLVAAPSYSGRVLALTNGERTSRGLRALALSACADGYADSWATSLSRAGALSHQPLRPVVTACRARGAGENVAFGNVTPEQLVAMWMASPGHRANLLKPESTHVGIGAVTTAGGRVYGVQVFLTG